MVVVLFHVDSPTAGELFGLQEWSAEAFTHPLLHNRSSLLLSYSGPQTFPNFVTLESQTSIYFIGILCERQSYIEL